MAAVCRKLQSRRAAGAEDVEGAWGLPGGSFGPRDSCSAESLTEHQQQASRDPSEPLSWPPWGSRPGSCPQFSEDETEAQAAQWPARRPQPAPCELCSLEQPSWAETLRPHPVLGEQGLPHSPKFRTK